MYYNTQETMNISVRNLEESDYETLANWWRFWWKRTVPRNILPDEISNGIIVFSENSPVCAGFLYRTSSSSLWWLEYVVSSPTVKDRGIREESLDVLIKTLIDLAEKSGAKIIFTSLKHNNLINRYLKHGFIYGDKNATNMVRTIS